MVTAVPVSPDKIQQLLEQWRQDLQESHFFASKDSARLLSEARSSRTKEEARWVGRVALRLHGWGWKAKQIAALYDKPLHWVWTRIRAARPERGRVRRRPNK